MRADRRKETKQEYADMARALAIATLKLDQATRSINDFKDAIDLLTQMNPDIKRIPILQRAMGWPT